MQRISPAPPPSLALFFLTLLLLALSGCSPSPAEVCDKLLLLASSDDGFSMPECQNREGSLRRRRGGSWYGSRAKCILRSTSYTSAKLCRGRRTSKGARSTSATFSIGGKDKKKAKKNKKKRKR